MAIKMAKKEKLSNGVAFTFANGSSLTCVMDELPEDMIRQLAVHGIAQKVGDSYASAETVAIAEENARLTWANLQRGEFNTRAQAGGGLTVEALARIKGMGLEDAQEVWAQMDEEQRETLKKNQRVKAMVEIIRGERAAKKLDEAGDENLGLDFELPKASGKKAK